MVTGCTALVGNNRPQLRT